MDELPDPVAVSEAVRDDAPAVADFLVRAWRTAGPGGLGFAGATDEIIAEIATPAALAARIGCDGRRMFVARSRDRVVGFAATQPRDAEEVELSGIVVAAESTGRGVGKRLVTLALRSARSDGYRRMIVRTEPTNGPAIGFYTGRGFLARGSAVERVGETDVPVIELVTDLTSG